MLEAVTLDKTVQEEEKPLALGFPVPRSERGVKGREGGQRSDHGDGRKRDAIIREAKQEMIA